MIDSSFYFRLRLNTKMWKRKFFIAKKYAFFPKRQSIYDAEKDK